MAQSKEAKLPTLIEKEQPLPESVDAPPELSTFRLGLFIAYITSLFVSIAIKYGIVFLY